MSTVPGEFALFSNFCSSSNSLCLRGSCSTPNKLYLNGKQKRSVLGIRLILIYIIPSPFDKLKISSFPLFLDLV